MRIEVCDAPHHLLLTTEPGTDDEGQIETWLTEEVAKTRLVVEECGLPVTHLPFHASGWRVHLEDLGRSLEVAGPVHPEGWGSDAGAPGWKDRWRSSRPPTSRWRSADRSRPTVAGHAPAGFSS